MTYRVVLYAAHSEVSESLRVGERERERMIIDIW